MTPESSEYELYLYGHLDGAPVYAVGEEIWQVGLDEAIRSEAETIVDNCIDRQAPRAAGRAALASEVVLAMQEALKRPGDQYRAPDGVLYELSAVNPESAEPEHRKAASTAPRVLEVIEFEALPVTARGSRRAIVRWSDGSTSEALRWYDDEVMFSEGDFIDKTAGEIRSLLFRRDRDWLHGGD